MQNSAEYHGNKIRHKVFIMGEGLYYNIEKGNECTEEEIRNGWGCKWIWSMKKMNREEDIREIMWKDFTMSMMYFNRK